MKHSLVFNDFFSYYEFDLKGIESKIDRLIEIALSTDNGWFEEAEERADLFLFKFGLMRVLNSAHIIATKEEKRLVTFADIILKKKETKAEKQDKGE